MIKNSLRKRLFSLMSDSQIDSFYKIYYKFRYAEEMQKRVTYGENNSKITFYIIRPRKDCTEGLLSLFWNVIRNIDYAREHGYEPIVDFQNYKTQYSCDEYNVWEKFFSQPTKYSLDEVYSSRNVILSGLDIQWYNKEKFAPKYDSYNIRKIHDFVFDNICFSDYIVEETEKELLKLNLNLRKTIGLYLRGTDYIMLKPSGHPIQPSVDQAMKIVDRFIEEKEVEMIFLVTEDGKIKDKIFEKYKGKCYTTSFDKFIYDYDGKCYLSHDKSINELDNDPLTRGKNYLIKMIILSRCQYLIAGNTMGSWASCVFSEESSIERFVFDLGVYGR